MIIQKFDPSLPLRTVRYARMSSELQNPRSPDQQFDEIERTKQRKGYEHWINVADYRDDGISGRYLRKRPGFREMIDAIRSGILQVDATLVDTLERYGRAHEIGQLRHELKTKYGVLILTADTGFADPTDQVGQTHGSMEAMRASSAAAQKAHDVLRGKIDAAKRGRWPGGPAPQGYRLATRTETLTRRNGSTVENVYRVLEPDPGKVGMALTIYDVAYSTGYGCTRIAKLLNKDADFVARYGRVSGSLVGSILNNLIYTGTFEFNKVATDVQNDCRIMRRKDPAEVILVENFCPAIIDPVKAAKVRQDIQRRSEVIQRQRRAQQDPNGKQFLALSPGLSLVYPLTGLVRCGKCQAAMRPTKGGAKSKEAKSYFYYRCPCTNDARCDNKIYLPGAWLWQVVVARLREVLFPLPGKSSDNVPGWLPELIAEARSELSQRLHEDQSCIPQLESEDREIDDQVIGWTKSLGKADLSPLVRVQIEQQMNAALNRKQAIAVELETLAGSRQHVEVLLDPTAAIERLKRLEEILAHGHASDINVELARHIESIQVSPDKTVVMRTHCLGVFEGVSQLLAGNSRPSCREAEPTPGYKFGEQGLGIRPRALARRRTTLSSESSLCTGGDGILESYGISLPEKWVEESIFRVPEPACWARDNASLVAFKRKEGLTEEKLAEHFGKSIPTIRKALKIARREDSSLVALPRKMARTSWAREYATQVAAERAAGQTVQQLAVKHCKSDTTIRAALKFAASAVK